MRGTSVGLDSQALLAPDEIDPERGLAVIEHDPAVDFRVRQACGSSQGKETLLEIVPRRGAARDVLVERGSEPLGSPAR
jgi:hypothetical protein